MEANETSSRRMGSFDEQRDKAGFITRVKENRFHKSGRVRDFECVWVSNVFPHNASNYFAKGSGETLIGVQQSNFLFRIERQPSLTTSNACLWKSEV